VEFLATDKTASISDVAIIDNHFSAVGVDALQTVYGGQGLVFRSNYVHDDAPSILFGDGTTSGVVIENNLLVRNEGDGSGNTLTFFRSEAPKIIGNTVWDNQYRVELRKGTTKPVVLNNVFDGFNVVEGATLAVEDYTSSRTRTPPAKAPTTSFALIPVSPCSRPLGPVLLPVLGRDGLRPTCQGSGV
jgi:hypothetical protein